MIFLEVCNEILMSNYFFRRFCYLSHERSLKFFKFYHKINCEHECLSELTKKWCGCVQFWMVREQETRVCGSIDENCFKDVERNFETSKALCSCKETCRTLNYEIKGQSTPNMDNQHKNSLKSRYSTLFFAFKEEKISTLMKKLQFSNVDILSFIGGILGVYI